MPAPPQPRSGRILQIKGRPLEFSFWPVERTTRRYGLGTRVFATDPWTVIRRSVERRCLAATKDAAYALLEQAEDFYHALDSGVKASKPLLLYYCFMNLAKSFLLTCRQREAVDNARHGLAERLDAPPNDRELVNAFLNAHQSAPAGPIPAAGQYLSLFEEFLQAIAGFGIPAGPHQYDLSALMPQVVPGHRLWAESTQGTKERFVSVERVEFRHEPGAKQIWLRLYLFSDDLRRLNITHQDLLARSRVNNLFHEVFCDEKVGIRSLLCFEQQVPVIYNHRPSDNVQALVETVRHSLWRTVLSTPPYRKYYLYAAPVAEHGQLVPQILSIYAITFYLGSIVRYRPHHFDLILADRYGPFIEAFLNDQPAQFIYLMASEFAQKEVTQAAIV